MDHTQGGGQDENLCAKPLLSHQKSSAPKYVSSPVLFGFRNKDHFPLDRGMAGEYDSPRAPKYFNHRFLCVT